MIVWPRTKVTTTTMVAVTPGARSVCRVVGFGSSVVVVGLLMAGTLNVIHPMTARVITETAAKDAHHPICCPISVPAGTPSDSARGIPVIAIAMARPSWPGGAMRRA